MPSPILIENIRYLTKKVQYIDRKYINRQITTSQTQSAFDIFREAQHIYSPDIDRCLSDLKIEEPNFSSGEEAYNFLFSVLSFLLPKLNPEKTEERSNKLILLIQKIFHQGGLLVPVHRKLCEDEIKLEIVLFQQDTDRCAKWQVSDDRKNIFFTSYLDLYNLHELLPNGHIRPLFENSDRIHILTAKTTIVFNYNTAKKKWVYRLGATHFKYIPEIRKYLPSSLSPLWKRICDLWKAFIQCLCKQEKTNAQQLKSDLTSLNNFSERESNVLTQLPSSTSCLSATGLNK